MQIERFECFVKELAVAAGTYNPAAQELRVFRFFDGCWYGEDASVVTDDALVVLLGKAKEQGNHRKEVRSLASYFYLKELDAVVEATFESPKRSPARDKYKKSLEATLKHANDAFNAIHDELTGLLDGAGFNAELKAAIDSIVTAPTDIDAQTGAPPVGDSVTLLSIDIDHFKQVNDTYGHDYGNIVLACLARRLQSLARKLGKGSHGPIRACVARPGGEEFFVLLCGPTTVEETKGIAHRINRSIADDPLPSEDELDGVSTKNITVPSVGERNITVSIGIASRPVVSEGQAEEASKVLRGNADTAMYCAKAGGRNRYRHFSEIMNTYGTVLEHHKDADVVTIDLGSRVGVRLGQDFLVYHPDFTGERPFVVRDGRTEKPLGKYPRLPSGRIIAFDVQDSIAFCEIDPTQGPGPFPVGARLEAVPVGSISHLIASSSRGHLHTAANIPRASQLTATIAKLAEDGVELRVGMFALNAYTALVDAKGTAFVNDCLAKLYDGLRIAYPNSAVIAQTSPTELAVVCSDVSPDDAVAAAQEAARSSAARCDNAATFSAGLYVSGHTAELVGQDDSTLSSKHALEYAAVAATVAQGTPETVLVFTPAVAGEAIYNARRAHRYEQALADYDKLRELGIDYCFLANQAALAASEKDPPDERVALEAINHAVALDESQPILWANKGYLTFLYLERAEAWEAFEKIWECSPGFQLGDVYLPAAALAMYEKYQQDAGATDEGKLKNLLSQAVGVARASSTPYEAELVAALEDLQEEPASSAEPGDTSQEDQS